MSNVVRLLPACLSVCSNLFKFSFHWPLLKFWPNWTQNILFRDFKFLQWKRYDCFKGKIIAKWWIISMTENQRSLYVNIKEIWHNTSLIVWNSLKTMRLDYLNRSATNEKHIKMYSKHLPRNHHFLKGDNYNITKFIKTFNNLLFHKYIVNFNRTST